MARQLGVGVQATRVGQDPPRLAAESVRLGTHPSPRAREGDPVRGDSQHGNDGRPRPAFQLGEQAGRTVPQLLGSDLVSTDRGSWAKIGHADAEGGQSVLVAGPVAPWRHARGMEGGPEAVPRPSEVLAQLRRTKAGVDPYQQQEKARPPDVGDRAYSVPVQARR